MAATQPDEADEVDELDRRVGIRGVFLLRALVLAALAALVSTTYDGDDLATAHAVLGAGVAANLIWCLLAGRRRFIPTPAAVLDVTLVAALGVLVPDLVFMSLVLVVASMATTAVTGVVRRTIPVTVAGLAGGSVGALRAVESLDDADRALTVAALVGAGVLTVLPAWLARTSALRGAREHGDLIDNVEALVWTMTRGADRMDTIGGDLGLGWRHAELANVERYLSLVHPDDRARVVAARREATDPKRRHEVDYRIEAADGSTRWLHEVIRPVGQGRDAIRGTVTDVTRRHEAEDARELYEHVVRNIEAAIVVVRPDDGGVLRVVTANTSAVRMFGAASSSMKGLDLADLLGADESAVAQRARVVADGGPAFEIERLQDIGIERQKTFSLAAFALPGRAVGLTFTDVTGSVMVAAALRRQALHDGLTGLPNRTLLRDRLRFALADAKRRRERVALILLDMNHFKEVNDALGHQYGDRLLTAFARRLTDLLRECDTIARLGGDEFALLLTHATNEGAARVVQKVTEAMHEPFELDGVVVQTTASMGVALFPDHAEDADLLTQRADVAMYTAKRSGGGWSVYSPSQDESSIERLTLLTELHAELDDGRPSALEVYYQAVLDLDTDRIAGAEALLRWPHPTMGNLNPEMVVELAELSGLIGNLAKYVTRTATTEAVRWIAAGHPLTVAVNLSARNLYDRTLQQWITALLDETGLPPQHFKIELTESEVMDDPVLAMNVINGIRELGIRTAIDDFGTGYSSLSYLRQLHVDEIKIDKSFVMSMMTDRNDLTIVRAVIDLAHNLGFSVLAEGVEDADSLEALREFGCDRVQGYHIARPMAAVDFANVLERDRARVQGAQLPAS